MAKRRRWRWDADAVRGLRRHLAVTQEELAAELGVRQQTVSEWETGAYQPGGASERVLTMVAEQAGFVWDAGEAGGAAAADERGQPYDGTLEGGGSKLDGSAADSGPGGETREAGSGDDEGGRPGEGGG